MYMESASKLYRTWRPNAHIMYDSEWTGEVLTFHLYMQSAQSQLGAR
jgi:hypothetical protein